MRSGRVIIAGIAALAVVAGVSATAQDRLVISGRATSIAEQQRALRDAKAQASLAHARSEQMEAKAARATVEADRLNARAAALAARIQESEAELRAGEARIAILSRLVTAQSARLAEQQAPLVRLTAALQSLSRRPPVLALLQPGTLADTIHIRAVFARVLPLIRQRTAALRADLAGARRLRAMMVEADRALRGSRMKLAEQRAALHKLEAQRRLAARNLTSGANVEAERATAMSERARDIDDLMGRLESAGSVRERLASLPGPQLRPERPGDVPAPRADRTGIWKPSPPPYRMPAIGAIIRGMGELSESGVRARGVTLATEPGAQIIAPANGRIVFADHYRSFGQIVIIDHGHGWSTLITDLGRMSVEVGQQVDQGAPLGSARTGENPIVTIELRRQGRPVDVAAMTSAGR